MSHQQKLCSFLCASKKIFHNQHCEITAELTLLVIEGHKRDDTTPKQGQCLCACINARRTLFFLLTPGHFYIGKMCAKALMSSVLHLETGWRRCVRFLA